MEDALTFAVVSCSLCHLNDPESVGGDLCDDHIPMPRCWAGSRQEKELDTKQEEMMERQEMLDAGRRCSYSVIYHRFKISVSYFDKANL